MTGGGWKDWGPGQAGAAGTISDESKLQISEGPNMTPALILHVNSKDEGPNPLANTVNICKANVEFLPYASQMVLPFLLRLWVNFCERLQDSPHMIRRLSEDRFGVGTPVEAQANLIMEVIMRRQIVRRLPFQVSNQLLRIAGLSKPFEILCL